MIHTERKFAYRHKPAGKWCSLGPSYNYDGNMLNFNNMELRLINEFQTHEVLYSARNIIEEDLLRSTMNGEQYAALNFSEFELMEVEIEYKIKEEYSEIKIHENLTGWPK